SQGRSFTLEDPESWVLQDPSGQRSASQFSPVPGQSVRRSACGAWIGFDFSGGWGMIALCLLLFPFGVPVARGFLDARIFFSCFILLLFLGCRGRAYFPIFSFEVVACVLFGSANGNGF